MYAASFEYHAPASVADAVKLLSQYGDDGKIITGGMSLIPLMKFRLAQPKHLIDLRKIADLKGVKEAGGKIVIGARTTHGELETNATLKAKCPVIAQVAAHIGDQQVRNRGTIGGSLMHADPSADLPAAMVALDAEFTLQGKASRTVKAADFFKDALETSAKSDEILVSISVPTTGATTCYMKLAQQASGFALVGVAAVLEMSGNTCKSARIGVTGVTGKAFRAASVEKAIAGKALDAKSIQAAAAEVAKDIKNP
ncbi:MAG TPA: xanthine dehydrogenase family protein subunit M, partial [bacterium]